MIEVILGMSERFARFQHSCAAVVCEDPRRSSERLSHESIIPTPSRASRADEACRYKHSIATTRKLLSAEKLCCCGYERGTGDS